MNTNASGKEPLLRKRTKLNYFIDDSEYAKLPIFQATLWDRIRKPHFVPYCMCLVFTIEKFFFFLALKGARGCSVPIALVLTFIVSTVACVANSRVRDRTLITGLHSQGLSFAIVGILDACYLFMLFAGAANLSAFSLSVQLQTPIVLMLSCRLIFTGQSFRLLHYFGALFLLAAIVLDIQQTESSGFGSSALLVCFSFLPHTVSQMLKIAMLRTGAFCCFSFNKWTLLFTFGFSTALLVLVAILDSEDGGKWNELGTCFGCLFAGENCGLEPLFLFGFLVATLAYQAFVYFVSDRQVARKEDFARLASAANVPLTCIGFALAAAITSEQSVHSFEWACVSLATFGSVLYFFYQESPPKLCYSK